LTAPARARDNERVRVDKRIGLGEVPRWVQSGMRVGVGGGPLMITPTGLIREVIRSGARDLHLVAASTGGFGIDLLVGAGCAASVEFAQIVLNEFGPAPNFRRWAESGRLRCRDHS
jgi:glutaconate CoA-transferase subunit A